jgi:putative peptide zinc metalloprotease protein
MDIKLNAPSPEHPLPLLRRDIKIYPGPDESDGSPTYNCLDPVRGQYFKISWLELAIFRHLKPGMTLTNLTQELNKNSTLKVTKEEIKEFFEDAARNHLLEISRSSEDLLKETAQRRLHPIMWTLYHYLYIRIPLLNPDHFLADTLRVVRPLVSKFAILTYIILTGIGVSLLVDRFDEFLHTFPYFFNIQGLFFYACAISLVKIIHEFSHAYVAKYYRLHIPTMGVAFIVLWPVLYTDVTDGWKLNKRSQRLAISFAGVAAELVLAGISTLGWALSEPGLLQSAFFIIASITWISTLAVNLNPAMRFDGYYLMSDFMGIDNLQHRAFAYTRWELRKWFLGMDLPPPEEKLSLRRKAFMFFYSIYTWIYRLILYTVVALFVYYEFTKILGIILFMVEIAFFIAPPFISESKQLFSLRKFITFNPRLALTSLALLLLAAWFIVPLPHEERFPAVTIPKQDQIIYIPQEGKVESLYFTRGDQVKPGQILAVLSSDPLRINIKQNAAEKETVQSQMHVLSLKDEDRAFLPEKAAELASYESKGKALDQQQQLLTIKSAINGIVYEWDDTLRLNEHVQKNQIIGKIAALQNIEVICFVPESQIHDINLGQNVTFRLSNTLEKIPGRIIDISTVRADFLLYPALASTNKGDLPVIEKEQGKLAMVETYYYIKVQLESNPSDLKLGERGYVSIRGPWKSMFMNMIRYIQSIYWRESGF